MPSLPLTPDQRESILRKIGARSIDDLFATIPPKIRENAELKLGAPLDERGLSEHELRQYFQARADKNTPLKSHFLGGGYYDNIIPSAVDALVQRGEFLTCYTPYAPEIAQGTLQAIFEFQTLITRMTGMEVANASLYDGATATAEAILMAERLARGNGGLLVSETLPPDYRKVTDTFLQCHTTPAVNLPWDESGHVDLKQLESLVQAHSPYAVVVASPNFFGNLEPIDEIRKRLPDSCHLIVTMPDPSALTLFEAPGNLGADIVVGEAHQFGTPLLFGGPHVGFFATRKKYVRQMPGRLVGETTDTEGRRAYALTLATREQHIRREKATSNICTNQGLIALRTTIYLSFLGKQGFRQLGTTNHSLYSYLKTQLEAKGLRPHFPKGLAYREGVFDIPNLKARMSRLLKKGIAAGIPLIDRFPDRPEFTDSLLICVHPKHTKATIDAFVEEVSHD